MDGYMQQSHKAQQNMKLIKANKQAEYKTYLQDQKNEFTHKKIMHELE